MTQYYRLFVDAWRYFRRYAEQIPLSDPAWVEEIDEKAALIDKHTGCRRLALKLMTQIEDELEQLDREAKR
jgi:hypothetical protein